MATYSKRLLTGSTNGKGIQVTATATLGTAIHTAVTGVNDFDEIHLWAVNISTSAVKLTIEWGGAGTDQNIEETIPGESGLVLVVPGLVLNNGLAVTAFAATTAVITIHGFVNRITS